ncbi:MAG: hypothetical protein HY527_07775 [Betaproteobacteria bacterium]|nr:hypothetical protein [Betaproteobacteria bacterium]
MNSFDDLARRAVARRDADAILAYAYSFYVPALHRKKGVERSAKFLELSKLQVRQLPLPVIRVTGTNGKGATVRCVESFLRAVGKETVCLTSPHIYSVRERIRLDGRAISWEQLGQALEWIYPFLELMRGSEWHPHPTDLWTWIAFALHASAPQAWGVYEVGKGGGSDIINVFPGGLVGLTNIANDHLEEFGGSLGTLLQEKLGLCSPGTILCHNALDDHLEQRLRDYCHKHGITAIRTSKLLRTSKSGQPVDHEHSANRALALAIVECLGIDWARGVDDAPQLPCRMERRVIGGRLFIMDGAHNPAAMKRVVSQFDDMVNRRRITVFGVQESKDWRGLMQWLARIPELKSVICVPMTTGYPVDAELLALEASANRLHGLALPGMRSGLRHVLSLEWDECLVTGSFKLFRDFDLGLHALGHRAWAIPVEAIDPSQPWMRPLA